MKEKRRIANPAFKASSKRDAWLNPDPGPGPAEYGKISKLKKSGYVFPKGKRFGSYDNGVPGPASYSMPTDKKPAHMIGKSGGYKAKVDNTPGPGAYGEVMCEMYHPSFNVKLDEK